MLAPADNAIADFWVYAHPAPGGSKRVFIYKPKRPCPWKCPHCEEDIGVAVADDAGAGNKRWKKAVRYAGLIAWPTRPIAAPLRVWFYFKLLRPLDHFVGGKRTNQLKIDAPEFPEVTPDATKLARSTEDALTGVIWVDDKHIVEGPFPFKHYGSREGVRIVVEQVQPQQGRLIA